MKGKIKEFFIIRRSYGDVFISQVNKEELLQEYTKGRMTIKETSDYLEDDDPSYWDKDFLIIKGKIVKPEAIETVVKYDIE